MELKARLTKEGEMLLTDGLHEAYHDGNVSNKSPVFNDLDFNNELKIRGTGAGTPQIRFTPLDDGWITTHANRFAFYHNRAEGDAGLGVRSHSNQSSYQWEAYFGAGGNYVRDSLTLGTQATGTGHAVRADRTITAGNGLDGGGNLTGNVTLSVQARAGSAGARGTINVHADGIGVDLGTTSTTAFRGDHGNTAYGHVTADGSSHTFINQSVTTTASPTFNNGYFNGDVGVGLTSPDYKLDVNGEGRFQDTLVVSGTQHGNGDVVARNFILGSPTSMYFEDADGNRQIRIRGGHGVAVYNNLIVGSGTPSSSDDRLKVEGTARITGTTTILDSSIRIDMEDREGGWARGLRLSHDEDAEDDAIIYGSYGSSGGTYYGVIGSRIHGTWYSTGSFLRFHVDDHYTECIGVFVVPVGTNKYV